MTTTFDAARFFSVEARTGLPAGDAFVEDTAPQIADAAARALRVFPAYAALSDAARADLLRALAAGLEAHRGALVAIADRETALGQGRLNGEIDRTAFQLRAIADHVADGRHRRTQRDAALPGPPPAGRPSLIRTFVPIGPVAVFAASNFPFAFSVLGGDTAAALGAGNPVIVKAHPAHPALSHETLRIARAVLAAQSMPEDVLQMVQGPSPSVGVSLVQEPAIAAVSFTGSLAGGRALQSAINERANPIPFFGELSSVNPVVAWPSVLATSGDELAAKLAASITLGSGQFCTSPGILILFEHRASRSFIDKLASALASSATHPMLTPGIRQGYERRLGELLQLSTVTLRTGGPSAAQAPAPTLIEIPPEELLRSATAHEEVFGPCCVVAVARDAGQVADILRAVGGSLTVTCWADASDAPLAREVIMAASMIAGRLLLNGVPTGVAVAPGQQHGGPWPSSSRQDTTSVGLAAIDRFIRPIAIQDAEGAIDLLPGMLRTTIDTIPTA